MKLNLKKFHTFLLEFFRSFLFAAFNKEELMIQKCYVLWNVEPIQFYEFVLVKWIVKAIYLGREPSPLCQESKPLAGSFPGDEMAPFQIVPWQRFGLCLAL